VTGTAVSRETISSPEVIHRRNFVTERIKTGQG
jgi:hypothetical protein